MPAKDNAPLTSRENLLLRTALIPAFLRRSRLLFGSALRTNQRVAGLIFDKRGRPVGLTFFLRKRKR